MYFHFKSKELLARAVIDAQHEITQKSAERIVSGGHSPLETIILLCTDFAELLSSHPVVRAGIRLTLESSAFGHAVQDPYRDWMTVVEELTVRGQEAGEIRESLDPAAFSRFLVASFTGVQMVSNVMTGRKDLMDRVGEMSSLVRLVLMPEAGKALPEQG
jgi:AcrR family transcriptional regulator